MYEGKMRKRNPIMQIRDVLCVAGRSGYMLKDLQAIRAGRARPNGFSFDGDPVTPGFSRITQPGDMLSVILQLDDGQIAVGDCMDVIFSGAAGRDPVFQAEAHLPLLEGPIRQRLIGHQLDAFRPLAEEIDRLELDGRRLHTALRYGVTQALLHAVSLARHETMAETVAHDYESEISPHTIPILGMCPTAQRLQVDKMIMKGIDVLPHANFVTAADLGPDGQTLRDAPNIDAHRLAGQQSLGLAQAARIVLPDTRLQMQNGVGWVVRLPVVHALGGSRIPDS
jgi:methylaspartate ammonia-lyase